MLKLNLNILWTKGDKTMTKIQSSLLLIASAIILLNAFIGDSLLLFLCGGAGLIGIATWGYSTKKVFETVKDKLKTIT